MKAMVLALGLAAVSAAIVGLSLAVSPGGAQAQGGIAAPANVRAVDGAETGQAVLLWDAVEGAAYYRIGWVNMETFRAVQNEGGREWLDVFAFYDVVNRRQTAQTITDLAPGVEYAFIMASVGQRFGGATGWSEWTYLTTAAADAVSCPTDGGTTPIAPGGGGTPTPQPGATATPEPGAAGTPTPSPTPVGRDYDTDDDGLIEISSLAQLDVIRHDLDGDGVSAHADHAAAFPNAAPGMGCRYRECAGYELFADLDFDTNRSGIADEGDAYWNDAYGWLPIGDPETAHRYNAVFEGNDRTIANLFIRWTDADHIGLFRATGADADIRNVRLTGVRVSGKNQVGGLVGSNGGGSISGSSVAGRVSGAREVGGLAGYSSGSITGSHSSAPAEGSGDNVGGLVGSNAGNISDSYATGGVVSEGIRVGGLVGLSTGSIRSSYATGAAASESGGYSYVGGLVGYSARSINHSHATGSVVGGGTAVGGLVGYSTGSVMASYAIGSVTGGGNVGGLVGHQQGGSRSYSGAIITASYATGDVTGSSHIGGLVGYTSLSAINASYATGSVTGNRYVGGLIGRNYAYRYYSNNSSITASYATGSVTGNNDVGGLVGSRRVQGGMASSSGHVKVTVSYWDTQTTGQSGSAMGTGKTTREMQSPTGPTGIYASWNADWWDFGTSRQYPALKYQGMDVAAQRR